jgi:3-phosphoshikimate 1-carboxyvinyltransferase
MNDGPSRNEAELLHTQKSGPLRGTCRVPGDKSLSHRALLFSALGNSRVTIAGLGLGQDNASTAGALRALGVPIVHETGRDAAVVDGVGFAGLKKSATPIDCGNSGTTIRLLMGLLAGRPFATELYGDASLSRRPMGRVSGPLGLMGARFEGASRPERPGDLFPPLTVFGGPLKGIRHDLHVASAQLKTALVLAGLQADSPTELTEPGLSRDHTERMLARMGAPIVVDPANRRVRIDPGGWNRILDTSTCNTIEVPGDISSAAFIAAAAAMVPGSDVTVTDVGLNPTRTGILDALIAMGADVTMQIDGEMMGEPWGRVRVRARELQGARIDGELALRCLDEIPILAMVAATATGQTLFEDLAELRVKESDRIKSIVRELGRAGVKVEERPSGLTVFHHSGAFAGGRAVPDHDHRIAMSAAVLGLLSDSPTEIPTADIGTSFPTFADTFRSLGASLY